MRDVLPNAAFVGFTGTPIDKEDKSTPRTFGSYIDKYSIQQAVDDGATVKIVYEGRRPDLQIKGLLYLMFDVSTKWGLDQFLLVSVEVSSNDSTT